MKKSLLLSIIVIFSSTSFFLSSCDNVAVDENTQVTDLDVEMGEDDAMAEDIFNSVDGLVDDELADLYESGYEPSILKSANCEWECKTVTVDKPDSINFPKTITIDYGDGCYVVCDNGDTLTRSGTIIITITDHWFVAGAEKTITFDDFYLNGVLIEGTISWVNLGYNEEGDLVFEYSIDDGSMTYSDTLVYTRGCKRFRIWKHHRFNPLADTILITGNCYGTNGDHMQYQYQITDTLKMIRCPNFRYEWTMVSGTLEMERNGNKAQLSYGEGNCDNDAVLTVNGESKEIQVKKRYKYQRKVFGHKGNR
jgi:hypothetical protein